MDGRRGRFDLHVMVDWSAASTPTRGRDSIWSAARPVDGGGEVELVNHPTRLAAFEYLDDLIGRATGRRVLIGIDVALGLPAGAAAVLVPDEPTWRGVWALVTDLVRDDDRNRNNRFEVGGELNRRGGAAEGPFWGRPHRRSVEHLAPTRPPSGRFPEHRLVEQVLRGRGLRPFSVWQLAYAGSVGGQSLTAIPVLDRLRRRHPDRVRVWPFEEPAIRSRPAGREDGVVVAEIWPSAFDVDRDRHPVIDAAQVLEVVDTTASADRIGDLDRWFEIDHADPGRVLTEEGWILGIDLDGSPMWPV
jgi:precorrin-8X/cobalt-precorrin-8 methylmutase